MAKSGASLYEFQHPFPKHFPRRSNALKVNLCWWFCVRRPIAIVRVGVSEFRSFVAKVMDMDFCWRRTQTRASNWSWDLWSWELRYIYIHRGPEADNAARTAVIGLLTTQKGGTKLLWNAVRTIIARTPYCQHMIGAWR